MSDTPGVGSIQEFLDFMPDTVTIHAFTGFASGTGPTYATTATTYPCRIEMKNHLIVDKQGREILARGRIITGSAVVPDIRDQITLPSEYVPLNPPILAVNVQPDELGNHHITIEIGLMGLDFDNGSTSVYGADALIARLTTLPGAMQKGAAAKVLEFADNEFMPHIKEHDVPFYLGNLRNSGSVWMDESGTIVLMEFGSPGSGAEEYAVEQHERTDYHHEFGRAKYLEAPLQEWAERFVAAAAEGVRNILTVTAGPWTRDVIISDFAPGALQLATVAQARAAGPRLVKRVK